jgi:hypothetical protein
MNPEARRIIQLARQARTPSAEDRRRVRAAVAIGVAAAAVTVPAVAAGGGAGFSAKIAGAMGVFTGIRGIVAGVVIASTSVGAGAYLWKHASAARVVEAPVVSSAPPVAAPVALPPPVSIPEPAAAPVVTPDVRDVHADAPGRARVAAPDPLAAELTLLHAAKQAWQDGNSQTAFDLAQKHAKLYPHSQLASERDALKVFALCGLGRTNDARDLAQALLSKAPGSPFRASLEQSCAMRQVPLP